MKGLLIKDFKLMKNQKQFFGVMLFVGLLFLFTYSTPLFVISYITIMFSMFAITSLTYDEFENGAPYLFTLPFSRKDYVKEKYLFAFLTVFIGWALVTAVTLVVCAIRGIHLESMEVLLVSLASITIATFFLSTALPIEIKFGTEKGRIGFMVIMGVFFLGFYLVMRMLERMGGKNPLEIIDKIAGMNKGVITGGFAVVWIAAALVSMLLSMRFIGRKEY